MKFLQVFTNYWIKIILKSRNVYYATLRILGSPIASVKQLLNIELLTISNIAYVLFASAVLLINNDVIVIGSLKDMFSYLSIMDYVLIYVMLIFMSKLITSRYSRKLFKTTAMNAYREEV